MGLPFWTLTKSKAKCENSALRIPNRGLVIISESALYRFVMKSKHRDAKPVQDWVVKSVLPAIRKDGMYVAGRSLGTSLKFRF